MATTDAKVGLIMGSQSDWATMSHCAQLLDSLKIPYETDVVSAHRTPDKMFKYAETAQARGLKVIIAAAGGAAHLPGSGQDPVAGDWCTHSIPGIERR